MTTQQIRTGRTENGEQMAVIEYCELKGITAVHIPNEGKRSARYGATLKRMGLRKGFPDLFFPYARQGYHGLFIELKEGISKKPTQDQLEWIARLNKNGYYATVCYGADAAIAEINEYFEGGKR